MQFITGYHAKNRRKLIAVGSFIRPYLYRQFGIDDDCSSIIFEYYAQCIYYFDNQTRYAIDVKHETIDIINYCYDYSYHCYHPEMCKSIFVCTYPPTRTTEVSFAVHFQYTLRDGWRDHIEAQMAGKFIEIGIVDFDVDINRPAVPDWAKTEFKKQKKYFSGQFTLQALTFSESRRRSQLK